MSRGLNNPKAFSTQDEAETSPITAPQITDASDFPHTGLIKALSLGMRGNYATTGFNATSVTDVAVTFANGVVFRDGEEVGVTGSTITIGSTTGTTTDHKTGYHLVVNETGTTTLTVRPPTGVDAVPAYNDDDVIIAILGYTGNTPMQIQYLTVNKDKNSLSIARNNSGTYTEMGTIKGDANSIDIVTTNSNADINLTPHGTGDVKLGNLPIDGDQTVGSGQDGYALIYTHSNAKAALATIPAAYTDSNAISAVEGESTLDLTGAVTVQTDLKLTTSSDDAIIQNVTQDKDIIFQVNDGGSAGTEVMRIDGDTSQVRVGICSASATDGPDAKLDIRGPNDNTVSVRASGTLSVENSAEQLSPSSRAFAFLSVDNGDAMVGGNIRLDDSVSGGTHDGYADGTNLRGGAGIVFTNTSSSDDGVIKFVRQNDSNDDTWTVKESAQIDNAGNLIANNNLRIGGELDHEGSNVGFFNTSPATKQTVGNLTPTAVTPDAPANPTAADHTTTALAISELETKLNALIDALQLYGLIS